MKAIATALAPEEIELNKKRKVIDRLKERLADSEEDMADLRAELTKFEAKYKMDVARFYADLDEIEAQIAEEEVKLVPDDEEIKRKAEEMRRRAEESAADIENAEKVDFKFQPTAEARKAYHDLARIIHPDLALDASEKERRHILMSQLNEAYSAGDQGRLNKLVDDFRDSPDLISGDSIGDNLVRAIRQIFQVKKRLVELRREKLSAELSETYQLRERVKLEMSEGRDMLAQMAATTKVHIMRSQRRLETLKNLNLAQQDYVKETFGMDIDEFRQEK